MSGDLMDVIDVIFRSEKKLIDSRWKHKHWCQIGLLFLSVLPGFLWEQVCRPFSWLSEKVSARRNRKPSNENPEEGPNQ